MYGGNFGVIEVASTKTTSAPGWAYVPDTGLSAAAAALQPSNRKRARTQRPNLSGADLSARQETKIRKELEALDRDTNRDVSIAVPAPKPGGSKASKKSSPNIRRILQSQKTFANYLDDHDALVSQGETNSTPQPNQHVSKPSHPNQYPTKKAAPQPNQYTKRNTVTELSLSSTRKADGSSRSRFRRSIKDEPSDEPDPSTPRETQDAEMSDAPAVVQSSSQPNPGPDEASTSTHQGLSDCLLVSVVPDKPGNEELGTLLAHLPLTYHQARASRSPQDQRYPVRNFCEVCGYWGRVRCIKCGARVCALACLEVHREECVTRYGL